ncbi:unnamed protein product [Cercopithifilaria johnstoni]|uniref:Uncharacterized protein n=1 Tax=Cercopithifilaria johnstoni TaxID=2874296 RepID=A0A8J2LPX2_9BILA|nr:unnamed protein product [Cercopithifilaria johnstoni]
MISRRKFDENRNTFSIELLSSLLNSEPRYYSVGHCNPSLPVSSDKSNWCDSVEFQNLSRLFGSHSSSQLPSPFEEDCQQLTIGQCSNDNTPTVSFVVSFFFLSSI